MSNDAVMTVTVKGIGDFSDVVSNVGSVQKALTKLKLPDKLGDNLSKNITNFYKEYEKYQKKISEGIKTQGDYNQVEKSLNNMRNLYQAIGKDAQKLTQLDMKDILNLDTDEFKKISNEITNIVKQIGSVKIDTNAFTKAFADIRNVTKNSKISGENGLLSQIIGHINTGQIAAAKKELQELQNYANKVAPRETASGKHAPGTLSPEKYQQLTAAINSMNGAVAQAEATMNPLIEKENQLQKELEETKQKAAQGIAKEFKGYNQASGEVEKLTDSLKRMHQEEFSFNREAQNIDRQIQSYFGLSQMIRKVGDIARDAFATVKELDKAMTETAVVTNFSVGDMWDMLPTYTQQANQLGSTIRDVYEAATLYYQQGLNTNQAMSLANETLKMARIAGLDAAEATNMMTAALRGFNMEINQQSAQKINDIYSELAAITASDTKEIGSAMERTASIANSANMEFATTSAFLAQMIETTREAPENLGTAMKTIVARFQEMKQDPTKLVDSEGVAMDANKVDKALKTIGVQLMNTKGEFRDLDDVFLDISAKWDSLTQGQQRYIATIAAGSRQQSRFIAMMSNYERTMELVDAANNSAGASQRQFEKTLDSMEAKLNKLKNAWDQFTMGLMNNQILKFSVDALTEGFTIVNKFIDILGKIPPKPFEGITKSVLTLATTLGMLNFGKKASRGLVMGGAAWWKGEEGGFTKNFAKGFKSGSAEAQGMGRQAGVTWTQAVGKAINSSSGTIKGAMRDAFNIQGAGSSQAIEAALRQTLQQASIASKGFNGWEAGDEYIEAVIDGVRNGQSTLRQAIEEVFKTAEIQVDTDEIIGQLEYAARAPVDPDKLSTGFKDLTKTASSAGDSIRDFGYALQGTPLEGFGNTLIRIGNLMDSMSRTAKTFGKNFNKAIEAAGNASGAGGKTTAFFSNMFPNLTKIIGLLGKIPPPILAIMAALAVVGAIALKTAHDQKKALESATDAAAKASEAYDSAKQETSELADTIEQIRTNEDAFDGLVVGTAAFNEQLVTANDQIMELIKKYPMLNDSKYLSTDKNGLMHISNEGLEAVKEMQKQRQANASALNLIQAADLNSVEAQQKAGQMRKTKGTDTLESLAQRRKEADLVEQQAEAQQQMAKLNAVNTALVDEEIGNREKVSAILASQYDARKEAISLEGESIHDLKQEYADFYGYKYDKSTKKLTDIEGNEIDVDKDTIKDAVKDIRILTDIEVDGKSLDNMINHIDSAFSQGLGKGFKDSEHLFSDILSDNININDDLLKEILQNPDKLQTAVDSLTEKEIAAVLGVSADAVEQAPDKYKDELTNKLTEKATNIAETQAQSYANLATMMAQTVGTSVIDGNGEVIAKINEEQKTAINEQLSKLTSEQKNMLSSIGTALQEGAGTDSMRTFIKQATDIYTSGAEDAITDLDNIIQGVNWDSPTARLKAYNDMIADGVDPSVQQLGQDLLNSTDSANLLGEAFEEFYDSNEFQEMAENMDKFADSSGKLNASSIQEMAKECGSLNNLLDSGAISAGGVAAALNAMGANGNITILDLNENLLKFLSTANQLDDVLSEAHSLIENFDWGIDTGESEDFAKDSTKKWKELYDNGEFGNQQLENYAKFVLGQERWNNELEKSGGNIEKALANMDKDISIYSDGFMDAWRQMADSGTYVEGEVGIHRGENNDIIWETQGKTTEELVDWLAETRGITKEWAKLMVEDFANYSYDFKTELASNDYAAALKNGDYIKAHKGADNTVNITQSEVAALAAAQNKTEEEILKDIQKYGKISEDELNVIKNIDENGNLLMGNGDIASFNTQYSQAELGEDTTKSWISQYEAKTPQGEKIEGSTELKSAISAAIADGFASEQATEMARVEALEAFKEGAKVFYDGVELNKEDLEDSQAFAERVAEITENSRWNAVGEAIAQGYISYIKGNEDLSNSSENWTSAKDGGDKSPTESIDWDSGTDADIALREEMRAKARENWSQLWASIKNAFTSGTPIEDPKAAAAEQSKENLREIWAKVKEAFTSDEGVEDPKVEAANKAKENWKSLWDKVKEVFSNNPDINIDPKVNKGKSNKGEGTTETTGDLAVSYTGKIANPEELKASLEQQITTLLNTIASQQSKMKATATINVKQGTIEKPKTQKAVVNYTKGKQAKAEAQTANVNYELGKQEAPKTKTATVNYTLGTVPSVPTQYATLKLTLSEDSKRFNVVRAATGMNNTIPYSPTPTFGSAAKGRYGTVGPKNKGGLTLTGEEGFEIAWLPSESRSVILGTKGPQLTNLPADAVVYTHEQSKKIIKQKAIPAGSHAGRHDPPAGGSGGGGGAGGVGSTSKTITDAAKDSKDAVTTAAVKVGKVSVWWENIARTTEGLQRKADKAYSKFEKYIKEMRATLKTTGTTGQGNKYITNMSRVLGKYQAQYNKANYQLKKLNTSTKQYDIKYKKGKKEVPGKVTLGKYIKYDKESGSYVIDQKKINKVAKSKKLGGKNRAEAIKAKAEEKLNDKLSKRNKAEDDINKTKAALDKFAEDLYKTFFAWKISLDEIWNLTQKIEAAQGKISRTDTMGGLLDAQIKSGLVKADENTAASSLALFKQRLEEQNNIVEERSKAITAAQTAAKEAYAMTDENADLKVVQDRLAADDAARKQRKSAKKKLDNAIAKKEKKDKLKEQRADLKKQLKKAKTKDEKKNIQKKIDKLTSRINKYGTDAKLSQAIKNAQKNYDTVKQNTSGSLLNKTERLGYEQYEKELKNRKKAIQRARDFGDFTRNADGTYEVNFKAEELEKERLAGNISEEEAKFIEEYYTTLVEASKNLDETINNLGSDVTEYYTSLSDLRDEWVDYEDQLIQMSEETNRKQIDNLKKLSDSVKQALDDLINDVKRKLDERRKQEENAKTEQDISRKQQRLAALRADTSGGHQVEIAQLEQEIAEAQQNYQNSLEDQLLDKLQAQNDEAAKQRERQISLQEELITSVNNIQQVNEWMANPTAPGVKEQMLEAYRQTHGYDKKGIYGQERIDEEFETFYQGLITNQEKQAELRTSIDDLTAVLEELTKLQRNSGKSVAELAEENTSAKEMHDTYGFSYSQIGQESGYSAQRFADDNVSYEDARKVFSAQELESVEEYKDEAGEEFETYRNFLVQRGNKTQTKDKNWGKIGKAGFNAQMERGKKLGLSEAQVIRDLAGTSALTWKQVVAAAKAAGYTTNKLKTIRDNSDWSADIKNRFGKAVNAVFGKKIFKTNFLTGGLADFTGPAWLDGTPSKPELVLNAKDTQNFIALKDVLANAMNGVGDTSNTYGDILYEININVDKIEKDYDVDRVVKKVKEEITKGAGYRNVTQVRNFR